MRRLTLLLIGTSLIATAAAEAQSRDGDRPRSPREATDYRARALGDGPFFRYRYAPDDDDAEMIAYRRGAPMVRCGSCPGGRCDDREWRAIERCRERAAELERREAEWRREARKREAEFEREMARRERQFRQKELTRWREHQRDMAERWRELDRWL